MQLLDEIDAAGDPAVAVALTKYFKVEPGSYGYGDRFVGVKLSTIRGLLKPYLRAAIPLAELERALASPIHEHRLAILCLLAGRASRNPAERPEIYALYLRSTPSINNWDLVDCSAAEIVGGHLLDKPRDILTTLVRSESLWERRIALVATHWFIRRGQSADIYALAAEVLDDPEDLIHKAAGWMLREAGKRVSEPELTAFLDRYAAAMPRTMLRYSIERLTPEQRKHYRDLR
ncbi:DNA alkylation repair protein [Kribbella sandramycini]|uniref:3-methyladenine DNA glycosylase AlkD n=1 Tax=Kribbella sandramycini TaxID=60450 RepID=A0A7Y4L4P2_9ACTN|nr:DNA alkylation repair protein [Kribbella sandramycini]MBB6566192.1 3-methyladenine DNA glycosylase AlkD [Kribbella sandramycini]NOL43141.1 DNA alkylation repair protein [Kribbella sandramycini]